MHELALVRSLLNQVSQIVTDQGGGTVREIRVQCGPLSGVEPALMLSAFEQFRADTAWNQATLRVDEVPLTARCEKCRRTFEPQQFRFVCPSCRSTETEVISGDGVTLESVTLEESELCRT